jgi:hypothetical protein
MNLNQSRSLIQYLTSKVVTKEKVELTVNLAIQGTAQFCKLRKDRRWKRECFHTMLLRWWFHRKAWSSYLRSVVQETKYIIHRLLKGLDNRWIRMITLFVILIHQHVVVESSGVCKVIRISQALDILNQRWTVSKVFTWNKCMKTTTSWKGILAQKYHLIQEWWVLTVAVDKITKINNFKL